jgi:hypothetical protein
VKAFGLPEFRRESMKTKDPDEAARLARVYLTELDELARKLDSVSSRVRVYGSLSERERARLDAEIAGKVTALPADQQEKIKKAGSVWGAGREMVKQEASAAFVEAGLGADYAFKEALGEEYDPDERELEEVQEGARVALHQKKGKALRDALTAAKIIEPTANAVIGLRTLLEKYCEAKGYIHTSKVKNKTRGQYEYSVRRFIEYHGDLPVADLTKKHLSEFAADFVRLPVSSRKDIRPLAFRDAVRAAERDGCLAHLSETATRTSRI